MVKAKPAHMVKGSAAAKRHMANLRAMVGRSGVGKGKAGAKKVARRVIRSAAAPTPKETRKGMTVTKALDIWALGGPAIDAALHYDQDGNTDWITRQIPYYYTGIGRRDVTFDATGLIKGYGGSVNRMIEKKLFRFLRIRPPRTAMKGVGDALDWITYFGATGMAAWERKDDPMGAHAAAYQIQNGINLNEVGRAAYTPGIMIEQKILPYVAQKMVRKGLRAFGVKLPRLG